MDVTAISIEVAELEPQTLLAVTERVPPEEPGVAVKLDVVELPLQPSGSDHVYEVAPFTEEIL
jgi:hypothetical protein